MADNKKDAKSILETIRNTIKGVFSNTQDEKDKPAAGKFDAVTMSYNVDGASPVFVAGAALTQGVNVYADATGTTPYPDGTYTVTGTGFSFTAVASVVTMIMDATGAGPGAGTPVAQTAAPAQQAAPIAQPPVPASIPQQPTMPIPRFAIQFPNDFASFETLLKKEENKIDDIFYKEVLTLIDKFATGTTEERLLNLETMCKALMMNCYSYKIQEIEANEAINAYTLTVDGFKTALTTKENQLNALKDSNEKLIELIEEFITKPATQPKALSEKDKQRFERIEKKEERIERYAEAFRELRKSKQKA